MTDSGRDLLRQALGGGREPQPKSGRELLRDVFRGPTADAREKAERVVGTPARVKPVGDARTDNLRAAPKAPGKNATAIEQIEFETARTTYDINQQTMASGKRGDDVRGARRAEAADAEALANADTWAETGRKFVSRIAPLFQRGVAGSLMGTVESSGEQIRGMSGVGGPLNPFAILDKAGVDEFLDGYARSMREAGTLPGQQLFESTTRDLAENGYDPGDSLAKKYIAMIAESTVQMIPAVVTAMATRSSIAGAASMLPQSFGNQYGESRENDRSIRESLADAGFMAAAEVIPSVIPLGMLMKPGGTFLSRTARVAGAEAIQEMMTETLATGYNVGVLDENMTWGEALANIRDAGIIGAGVGGAMSIATQPLSRPSDALPDDAVLTPEDRESPIPNDVIAAGRRAAARGVDPEEAAAKVAAFTADPTSVDAPTPEEAIAALNARRNAPLPAPATGVETAPAPLVATPVARPSRPSLPAAQGNDIPADYVQRTGGVESGGDPTARNPNSSATGKQQFIDSTWLSLMRKHRARETQGMSDAQVLSLRNNPLVSDQMSAVYARENAAVLRKNKHRVDNGTLYLSHFLGAGGANSILSASPDTPVSQILKPGQISANKSILAGKTAGQVVEWAYRKMGGTAGAAPSGGGARAEGVDTVETPELSPEAETESVDAFITRILGDEAGAGGDVRLEEAVDTDPANPVDPVNPAGSQEAPRAQTAAREQSERDVAITAAGREVPVRYKVVEADSLVSSNLEDGRINPAYPADRQPRDRSRDASLTQVQRIASELDPRRLGRSINAADGAPIVSPDNIVESGNGRTMAIRRAYAMGGEQAQSYREFLAAEGYDVSGMAAPVLVRERDGAMSAEDVAAFTREANERDTLAYSATEQTQSDAASMPDALLDLYREGDVDSTGNRDFVRAFMQSVVGANDQGNMIAADGALSQQAVQRIRGALLFRAFGDERIVAQAFEATDSHIRAIAGALTDVAAIWSKLRAGAGDGRVDPAMDISANVTEAVALVDQARREKRSLADLVGQRDAFSGAINPVTEGVLSLMFNGPNFTKPAARAKVAQALRYYVEQAMMAAPDGGLFGDKTEPGAILNLAKGKPTDGQLDLETDGQQPETVAPASAGEREPSPSQRDDGPRRESASPQPRREDASPVAPTPSQPPAASAPTVTEMPSGKSVIIQGATPEQLAAVRAALPEKVQPIENAKLGGTVYSKKHEAKIRAALDALAPYREVETAAAVNRAKNIAASTRSDEGAGASAFRNGEARVPPPASSVEMKTRWLAGWDRANLAAPVLDDATVTPAVARGVPVPRLVTDKKNLNPYVRNGDKVRFSERVGYAGGDPSQTYTVSSANAKSAQFTNDATGGGTSLQNYEMQGALRRGVMERIEAEPATDVVDDVPEGLVAPLAPAPSRPFNEEQATRKRLAAALMNLEAGQVEAIARRVGADPRSNETWGSFTTRVSRAGTASQVQDAIDAEAPRPAPREAEAQPAAAARPTGYGADNKLVTADRAEEVRRRLRAKMSQLNSGVDPEALALFTELGVFHIEAGARRFREFAKAVANDVGVSLQKARPFLRSAYNGARDLMEDSGASVVGMDGPDEVATAMRQFDTWATEDQSAVPAPETTPPPAPAVEPQTAAGNLTERLRAAFVTEFENGRSFASITEARKFAADTTGERFETGTPAAKSLDEAIETAVVQAARSIAARGGDAAAIYQRLVDLYAQQPRLGVRTSTSVEQQAYSTPVPLAFLASRLAGIDQNTTVYEPSAGNGALMIDARATYTQANELNPDRAAAIRAMYRGATVTTSDATEYLPAEQVDAVIANPPFGSIRDDTGQSVVFDVDGPYTTREIDHAIAWQALKAMKDGGRAVLIVGSVAKTAQTDKARADAYNAKAKREFYFKLYGAYNVVDHFTVSGDLYEKQGAGWPVDVVVIEGRGKSALPLPASRAPRQYDAWPALLEALTNERRNETPVAIRNPNGSDSVGGERLQAADAGNLGSERGSRIDRRAGLDSNDQPDGVRPRPVDGQPDSAGMVDREAGRTEAVADQGQQRPDRRDQPRVETQENERQLSYTPGSRGPNMGTLVPINMQAAINDSLDALRGRVGDIDGFVADRLGYDEAEMFARFGGEQVDAIALAIDNIERGAGFIIGDQTGIGKGRVVAAVIRYAMRQGRAPIFVTEKPNLYKDMARDLTDIGVPEMLGRDLSILMTDAAKTVPLDDDSTAVLRTPGAAAHNAALEKVGRDGLTGAGYDVLFTTYSQMQSIKGEETPRQRAIRALASGGVLILDESHNAGGQGAQMMASKKDAEAGKVAGKSRAEFVRELVGLAHGVFYSSATYAKRPDVMDLYSATDMKLAVDDVSKLGEAIAKGGVPMQQIVAAMLARAGQYIRRERSFDGIAYNTPAIAVDREQYEAASAILSSIQQFSENYASEAAAVLDEDLRDSAENVAPDNSLGGAGAASTNFTAIMHNVIDQMLLAFKAQGAADSAIAAITRGEKPVITVANTLESVLTNYVDDDGLSIGQEVDITFADVFRRYLERSRWVTVRKPFMAKGEKGERVRLTDEQLGAQGVVAFREAMNMIGESGLDALPGSPIDAIISRIEAAGFKVAEITGRTLGLNYRDGKAFLKARGAADKSIAGRIRSIQSFNDGSTDAMVLNQSGATGLSLHASERFKDQRKRRMIIAQAEKNIDTHMQMLGRVHRTGQVVLPEYDQLVADIPAEKRPASVLAKKMASLNANTTASRDSAVTARDVPDFMNVYGDEVAARVMAEEPDLHDMLARPLNESEEGEGYAIDGAMRKVTGRIPLMPLARQEELYQRLEEEYSEFLRNKEAAGENALEAKTFDLQAETEESMQALEGVAGNDSPFAAPVMVEKMSIKRLGKPHSSDTVREMVAEGQADAPDLDAAKSAGRAFMAAEKAKASPDRMASIDKKLRDNAEMFDRVSFIAKTGEGVRVFTENGNFYGMVTSVARTGNPKNPLALGSWKATIALVDAARQITIPFSQIAPGKEAVTGRFGMERSTKVGDYPIIDAFDMMQSDSRETRNIITGNILSGFDFMKARGAIINFTDSTGEVRQGILTPRGWSLAKQQQANGVVLTDQRAIVDFIATLNGSLEGIGRSGSVLIQMVPANRSFIVTASKSKKAGGEFFLNRELTRALGTDFVSSSSGMIARAPADRAGPAIEALLAAGVRFEVSAKATDDLKQRARELQRQYAPRYSRTTPASAQTGMDFDAPQPERTMTQAQRAELNARQQQGMSRRGGQEAISDQEGGLFAAERAQGSLFSVRRRTLTPEMQQARADLYAQIESLGLKDRVALSVVENLFNDPSYAGSYERGLITIATNVDQNAADTLNHEAIHALRDLGAFRSAEWTALTNAAKGNRKLMQSVRERYDGMGLTEEQLLEEAASDMFADWRAGRDRQYGLIRTAFERLGDIFNAIRELVRLAPSAEAVLRRIESGAVGRRDAPSTGTDGQRFSIPRPGPEGTQPNEGVLSGLKANIDRLIGDGTAMGDRLDLWRTNLQDRMLPLLRTQQRITVESGQRLTERANPYLAEELMSGKVGYRLERLTIEHVQPLFDSMKAEGISKEELETYLYARHAPERNARISEINSRFEEGTGSGMTDAEAASIMARVEAEGKQEALDRVAARVDALLRFAVETRVEAGLLSQDEAEAWATTYQHYVPLRGMAEIDPEQGGAERPRRGSGINVRGKESRRAFGRESRADDILAYSMLQAEEAIVRAGTNEVGQAFHALAKANPDKDFWQINKITRKPVFDKRSGRVRYQVSEQLAAEDADYTVSLKIDGEEYRVTMNRQNPAAVRLATAMRNLNGTDVSGVLRVMSSINRWLSTVNTGLNPEFVITNAFRDLQTAGINLKALDQRGIVRAVLKDYPAAMKASVTGAFNRETGEWGKWYREFVSEGGRVYYNKVEDLAELRRRIDSEFAIGNPTAATTRRAIGTLFKYIEQANIGVENAVRLSAFKNARERGLSKAEAASLAKNLTVNFNRRGSWGVAMNSMYLFYNASVQGSVRLLQAMKSRSVRRVLYGAIAAGAVIELLNVMLSGEDEDGELFYDKISEYDKSRNIIIMSPGGDGQHIKIPLPYGYNAFFAMGRAPMEMARGKDWKSVGGSLIGTVVDSFNPIGGTQSLLNFIAPTVADPIVDLTRNRDFADRPIMPEQNQYGPPTPDNQRYWGSIAPHWRAVTDGLTNISGGDEIMPGAIDVSPETLEYMSGVVTGAAGTFFIDRIGGLVEKAVAGEDITTNDLPLIRKIVGQRPSWYDKSAYYERVGQIEQALAYAKGYDESEDYDAQDAFAASNEAVLGLESDMKSAKKAMTEIRARRRELIAQRDKGDITASDYREERATIDEEEDAVVLEFNTRWNETFKEAG